LPWESSLERLVVSSGSTAIGADAMD
jgi:hypothetical protein